MTHADASGPVLFAYDGSELARLAVDEAARQLSAGREALVLTVWEPFDVGFVPPGSAPFDARDASKVKDAAEQTAAEGAAQAEAAGFRSQGLAARATPAWRGIVDVARERRASLIVLGSHGRTGLAGVLLGSVAHAVATHAGRSVLIAHRPGV